MPIGQAARANDPRTPAEANGRRWLLFVLSLLVLLGFGSWAGYSAWRRGDELARIDTNGTEKNSTGSEKSPTDVPGGQESRVASDQDDAVARVGHDDKPAPGDDLADDASSSNSKPPAESLSGQGEASGEEMSPPEVLGLYALRTAPKREQWVAQLGGTPASETAVGMGLEWLARHQMKDGHWGPDCLGHSPNSRCEQQHVCEGAPGGAYEAALTGLALLALQAGGHYDFNEHPYSGHVAKGLNCLVDQQGLEGELVGSLNELADKPGIPSRYHGHYMYEHAIATFALAEACAVARASGRHPDARILDGAIKAEKFIEAQQHHDGGWRYGGIPLSAPSDCSVSGWAMLALKSCREAEIPVSDSTFSRMVSFFRNQEDPLTGRTHYQTPNFGTDALTGVGMMLNQFVTHQADSPLNALAAPYLAEMAESRWGPGVANQPHDYYLWYNCTLAMYQAGGEPWNRWNKIIREKVQTLQVHGDGCDRGSWAPDDQWGGYGGRIYSTALATLTLEVYYRFAKQQEQEREQPHEKDEG